MLSLFYKDFCDCPTVLWKPAMMRSVNSWVTIIMNCTVVSKPSACTLITTNENMFHYYPIDIRYSAYISIVSFIRSSQKSNESHGIDHEFILSRQMWEHSSTFFQQCQIAHAQYYMTSCEIRVWSGTIDS